jgi:UDP-N-acetylmuramoyl-tripeptide--D-alanyl-D-alanine ligase
MQTARNSLLLDAYNANPDSMKAALRNFAALPVSPKALILGDMKELGSSSEELHREIIDALKAASFDRVYLCGEAFTQAAAGDFAAYPTVDALRDALCQHPLNAHHILIKGSRSMALEQVIDLL